ncbi:protein FAM161A-like [Phyllopteryx taeniolatus]|uniref:protein FAM161A-like n=1 Tax=Phyllopteryx taeniolatus TaxID=161469 RepID=UPI002AD4DDDB|nr:protein FAM161A-like [Phyllopteryx taeniolatus]
MALRWRSDSLDGDRLVELYQRKDGDLAAKCSSGRNDKRVRSSLSVHIYGLQRRQNVDVSRHEYDHGLEELKKSHLENMAELERMYISPWEEDEDGRLRRDGDKSAIRASSACRKLQRINSQEELDFPETSSGSDQSELSAEDGRRETTPDAPRRTSTPGQTFDGESSLSPEDMMMIRQHLGVRSSSSGPNPQSGLLRQRGSNGRPGNSKVTVPRPFQMMLREVRKVRTRSELELENALLRRELDELRECQKKFRASPAPAHVRLPLYDIIGRRPPRPFHFLERERKKSEAKMAADLAGAGGPQGGRRAFAARRVPVSRSASGARSQRSSPTPSGAPDPRRKSDAYRPQRAPSPKAAEKQPEVSIELVKPGEWAHVDPMSNGK